MTECYFGMIDELKMWVRAYPGNKKCTALINFVIAKIPKESSQSIHFTIKDSVKNTYGF